MAQASNQELTDRFIQFYRNYYRDEIGELAQQYPNKRRSLYIDYDDLYQFDSDLAEDYRSQPDQLQEYAEEALRLYDLPADVKLGNAHVRLRNLPGTIDSINVHANHIGKLVAVEGIVAEATDANLEITDSAFECQRCGTMNYIPQRNGEFQQPTECQGCERQGPFRINFDQSEFIDSQVFTLRSAGVDVADEGKPLSISVSVEDDLVGVSAGDYVTVNGVLHIEQKDTNKQQFEPYLEGVSITQADESSPSFEQANHEVMDIDTFVDVASQTLATLPDTAHEEETKEKLITPLIEALGWNKFDNDEWRFEYTDSKTEKRPDYALFAGDSDSPDIVIEAKRLGKSLEGKETQIYDYLRIFSAEYGMLTNGESYRIYRNPPESDPDKVAQLELSDIPEAGIMDNVQPSAFAGTSRESDASENEAVGADETSESNPTNSVSAANADLDLDSEEPVVDLINQMDDGQEDGVPKEAVVEKAVEAGMEESAVTDRIKKQRKKGNVYSPVEDHLRTTTI